MADIAKTAKLNIAFATALPFPSEGECGIASNLPRALKGANAGVIAPLYKETAMQIKSGLKFLFNVEAYMLLSKRYGGVYHYVRGGVEYYFIENDYYFNRKGYWGHYDDGERFAFFCRAAIECAKKLFGNCIIHCCDSFTALIPVFLKCCGRENADIKTALSLGDVNRQGKYSRDIMESSLSLPEKCFDIVEYEGDVNVLKGAILTADAVIATNGCWAEFLKSEWELAPLFDNIKLYTAQCGDDITQDKKSALSDKAKAKAEIIKQLKLNGEDVPLIAYAGEFNRQSGADSVAEALPQIINSDINFAVIGRGEISCHNIFSDYAEKYKSNYKAIFCADKSFENNLLQAADIALFPHKPQPCIEGALNAMARGCVCVGDASALKDVIKDGANGFLFTRGGLTEKIKQAANAYSDKKLWNNLAANALNCKFTWENSTGSYLRIYKKLIIDN